MNSELDKTIGNKEPPRLSAGSVIVKDIKVDAGGEGKKKFKIIRIEIMHPDRDESVFISNMKIKKVQGNNETITTDGIWYREDEDGNIDMTCNTAKLLKFYNKTNLASLINSSVTTELNNAGYLVIKAY